MEFIKIKNIKELDNFSINRLGYIVDNKNKIIYEPKLYKGYYIVYPKLINNNFKKFVVARLLAFCFLKPPIEDYNNLILKYIVSYKDKNSKNIKLDNLYWIKIGDKWKEIWEEKISLSFKKYPYLDNHTLYYPNPMPCKDKPGFFMFPYKYSRRAINKEGVVLDLINDKVIKPRILDTGYLWINHFDQNNIYNGSLHHRIIGMLFVNKTRKYEKIPFSNLFINHKDGNKQNNNPDNLEWCNHLENMEHYHNVLTNNNYRYSVLQKNILTGEIKKYESIYSLSLKMFLSKVSLRNHLFSYQAGAIAVENFVYKLDDGKDWPLVLNSSDVEYRIHPNTNIKIGYTYNVIAENILEEKIYLGVSISELCYILGLNAGSVENNRIYKGVRSPFKNWIFYPYSDNVIKKALEERCIFLDIRKLKNDSV